MAQRKVALALTGLYVLIYQVWATLEVSMEDRVEVYLDDVAEIHCIYKINESVSSPTIQWFVKTLGSKRVRLSWTNESGAIVDRGTAFSSRISVSHSQEDTKGNSTLTIMGVRVSDAKDFICQVNMSGIIEEGRTQLQVFNAPSGLSIHVEAFASVEDTRSKIATCDIRYGYPTPKITWYKDRAPLYPSADVDVNNRLTVNSNGLYSVQSELYLKVIKEDEDAFFYCEVTYPVPGAENMIESEMVNISIHYPSTNVHIFQNYPKHLVKEGDQVELICEGDGNPQPIKTFMHNNEQISLLHEDRVVLNNVTRKDSGLYECSCLDTTSYEESIVGNMTLMVHFLDPVVITPENPESLNEGQDLSLTCNALSSLSTHAVWYKDDMPLDKGNVLVLRNASFTTAGTYRCEVMAPELPELNKSGVVHVSVRGKPMITEGVAVIPLDTEKSINVSCHATGHPTPTIHWSLSDDQAPLGRWDTKTKNSVLSIISISTTSDITASCKASNDLGTTESSRQIQATELKQTPTTTTTLKTTATTTTTTTTATTATTTTTTTSNMTETSSPKKHKKGGNGYIIAIVIIFILLLAILGSVLYFLYKKGRISCGRSGKQDLTKEKASCDDIVVEIKNSKSEEAVLLQGVNGDKKTRDQ